MLNKVNPLSAISAGTTLGSRGTVVFSNSNGVSFGMNGNTITGSVAPGGVGLSAGTQSVNTGTVVFSNSNGISFGMSGSSQITASYTVPSTAGLLSNVNVSAGTTSNNLSAIVFSNSNAFSFGLSGSTVTGSYTVPTQTVQTQNCVDATLAGNTSGVLALVSSGTMTLAGGNNITLSQAGNAITISGPNAAGAQTGISSVAAAGGTQTAGMISFVNSNGLTFGMSTGAVTGTITGSYTVPSTAGLISAVNLSAGTTSGNLSAFTLSNSNGISFGLNASTITASVATSLTNINVSAGTTSNNLSAIVFSNSNAFSFGLSGSTVTGSYTVPTQTVDTLGFYAVGNTTQNSSTTLDARTVSFNAIGAASMGYSNGSVQVSVPQTSSLSASGWVQISTNGSTISIGATTTANLYAVGNTFGTSSGTADMRTLSISGASGIQVAGSNSGWVIGNQASSVFEPFPILTGTAYSSHAPASWWFNRVLLTGPLACSNINVIKSLSVSVPGATSQASSGTEKISYSHGITVFSRQNYGAQSTNLTTVTTASMGFTATMSYTSTAQSAAYSWVTNTTGGTTSFSTTSSNGAWSNYFSGPMIFPIPCLTTFQPGEYFFAHAQSSTTGTLGSNVTLLSFSNLHIAPQVLPIGVFGSSVTQASLGPWGMGAGIASAVTTNNSMAGSVISAATQNNFYMALSNA